MRGFSAVVIVSVLAPVVARAQQMEMGGGKHELGADVSLVYSSPNGGDGHFLVRTPVDIRFGVVTSPKLEIEPRLTFFWDSKENGTPNAPRVLVFTPDVNVLYALTPGGQHKGSYVTAGLGLAVQNQSGLTTNQWSLNGGLGTRLPYEAGAIRLEAFGRYGFKGDNVASVWDLGIRAGLSLWH